MTERKKGIRYNYDQKAPQPAAHEEDEEFPKNISSSMASPYALDPDVKSPLSASPSTKTE